MKFHFCQNDRYEIHTGIEFQKYMRMKLNIQESALIQFVSGKLCSDENLMSVWNFISVKMTGIKFILFWVSFRFNSCKHK